MIRLVIVIVCILVATLPSSASSAANLPCAPVEAKGLRLDGLLGDWHGVTAHVAQNAASLTLGRAHWQGKRDLSLSVRCNYDAAAVYLAMRVRDDAFIRSRKRRSDDHLTIDLGKRTLMLYPSDLDKNPQWLVWKGKRPTKGVVAVEAFQKDGYSIELKIPWAEIPEAAGGQFPLPFQAVVNDVDLRQRPKQLSRLSSGKLKLAFAGANAQREAFLKSRGYRAAQIRQRWKANVAGDEIPEQVLWVGRTVGIIGRGLSFGSFFYFDLPVAKAKDILWVKLIDLNGDATKEFVARFRQVSGGGERELVSVYRFNDAGKFVRPLTHELVKKQGPKSISSRLRIIPRKRRGGHELVIDETVAHGFTAANYQETAATDVVPILLPWDEQKAHRYRFEGDEYFEF
jgi:hypothetical protein